MKRKFPNRKYAKRAHAECVFSRLKRHLGSALRARKDASQDREMLLRVLTHNLMLLLLHFFKNQSRCSYMQRGRLLP